MECALLAAMCLVSAFAQELIMRGYLIPRFEELIGSTGIALFLSTVLFTCYHGYEGLHAFISVGIAGLIYGAAFCAFRRLTQVTLAHAIYNFVAYLQQ
jgi:uncharacterized protein